MGSHGFLLDELFAHRFAVNSGPLLQAFVHNDPGPELRNQLVVCGHSQARVHGFLRRLVKESATVPRTEEQVAEYYGRIMTHFQSRFADAVVTIIMQTVKRITDALHRQP